MVKLGTKWPSITSRWSIFAPPRSTRAMSSAKRAKSADRIEGTISIIYRLRRFYHTGVETVPGVAPRNPVYALGSQRLWYRQSDVLIFLGFERTGCVHQHSAGGEHGERVGEQRRLAGAQVVEIFRFEPPLDFRIAAQRPGAGAGRIHQDAVERAREGQRTGAVEDHQVGGQRLELDEAVEVQIGGDSVHVCFQRLRGLVAGRGAEVEKALARLEREQGHDGLRADVLR